MERYIPLKRKSSELGDEYYRCIREVLAGRDGKRIGECLRIGRKYKTALKEQLEDLKRLSDHTFIEHERMIIDQYLKLIDNDLNKLKAGEIDALLNNKGRERFDH